MPTRPNLLFVFTDQHTADALSCAGADGLHTPAIDSIAANGARFENTYCTFPLCTPSRYSLMTGRMPQSVRCDGNSITIPDAIRQQSLGHLLTAAGYECGYAGKWHVPETNLPPGFGFEKISDFHDQPTLEGSVAFLKRARSKPFALIASFHNPHDICEWARGQTLPEGPIEDAEPARCPTLPMNFAVPSDTPEALIAERTFNERVHPTAAWDDAHWRRYRFAYRRLIEKVDAQIGQLLATLRAQNLEENTLIIFSSDHGDGNAAHHWNQKSAFYDEAVRVPMIVSWKGVTLAGKVDREHLVSNGLDLLPTLCDYAGAETPSDLMGRSLRSLAETGSTPIWRDQVVTETCFTKPAYRGTVGRMVRTARFKYAVYSWGKNREQLFDLQRDPGEMRNLAEDAAHSQVLNDHRARLKRWITETGDSFDAAK